MIYVHWIFIVLYVAVIVGIMLTVLMDNRQPAKTIAWVLVLLFVPVVGIVLYIFFGQNTRKMKLISGRSLDQLSKRSMLEFVEQRNLRMPEYFSSLVRLFTNHKGRYQSYSSRHIHHSRRPVGPSCQRCSHCQDTRRS